MKFIPYSHQQIRSADIRSVVRALRSQWLTQGPAVERFERALARAVGARFAAAFSSGTAALQAAYFAARITKGDEVITTPLTFVATVNTALWQGAQPVFADVEEDTGNLDPAEVEKKITTRTRVLAVVDYAGLPARMGEFRSIAKHHRLVLIEDAAHSLGARCRGTPVGGLADMTVFSFHPVKSITTGEGGAVTTRNEEYYRRMILFRNHGITRDPRLLKEKSPGGWYYEMQELGQNFRLTDIQAALGVSQLRSLSQFVRARRVRARRYQRAFRVMPDLILPSEPEGYQSAWHLYPIRLSGSLALRRDRVFEKLREAKIGVQVHFIPVYMHPYYRDLKVGKTDCPRAERFYRSVISLPLFPGLTPSDQKRVIRTMLSVVAQEKTLS